MKMEQLKADIYEAINKSRLPIDCVYYLLKDIFGELTSLYNQQLAQEEKNKEEKEEDRSE